MHSSLWLHEEDKSFDRVLRQGAKESAYLPRAVRHVRFPWHMLLAYAKHGNGLQRKDTAARNFPLLPTTQTDICQGLGKVNDGGFRHACLEKFPDRFEQIDVMHIGTASKPVRRLDECVGHDL